MPKPPSRETFRKIIQEVDMPSLSNLEEIVKHPWANGMNFNLPPTEAQLQTLTQAGFEYDEKTQLAWRKDRFDLGGERPDRDADSPGRE